MVEVRMRYAKARTTFGEEAVARVLSDPKWREQYPELFAQLASPDKRLDAVLPEPMVIEMAKDGIYYYRAHEDGERLFCHGQISAPPQRIGRFLSAFEAVQEYGSECVYEATEKSVGYKSMIDTFGES